MALPALGVTPNPPQKCGSCNLMSTKRRKTAVHSPWASVVPFRQSASFSSRCMGWFYQISKGFKEALKFIISAWDLAFLISKILSLWLTQKACIFTQCPVLPCRSPRRHFQWSVQVGLFFVKAKRTSDWIVTVSSPPRIPPHPYIGITYPLHSTLCLFVCWNKTQKTILHLLWLGGK